MASEYLKWKYRDVEHRREARELTPVQKRKNWWRYHWKYVLAGLLGAGFLFVVVRDRVTKIEPDCSVALVTRYGVTEGETAPRKAALEAVCPDSNGDGTVCVAVNIIQLDYTSTDMSAEAMKVMEANIDKLNFDFYTRQSGILLLDDPENFQRATGALAYLDGSQPPEGPPTGRIWSGPGRTGRGADRRGCPADRCGLDGESSPERRTRRPSPERRRCGRRCFKKGREQIWDFYRASTAPVPGGTYPGNRGFSASLRR